MPQGIAIVGLNGSGKTTLGRALAEKLGFFRVDVEDYSAKSIDKLVAEIVKNYKE